MKTTTSRRFFILTASIGTGHSQAARAIAEAIKAAHPEDSVRVLDFISRDLFSVDRVVKGTYLKMIQYFPELYDILYSRSQRSPFGRTSQTLVSFSFRRRMKRIIEVLRPDALIFTHPFPAGAADILKEKGDITTPLLDVITDFDIHQLWVGKHTDAFCVATETLAEELKMYGIEPEKIHVTGIPVRKAFLHGEEEEEPGTVLLMGGGLGLGDMADTLQRLDRVLEISKFIVITGRNIDLYEEVATLAERLHHPIELHSYTNKVASMMRRSSLLVTKPGALTCTEAMTVGLPMVLVNTLPGQERLNAMHMVDQGCATWVKRNELAETVADVLRHDYKRKAMRESCHARSPHSADDVVAALNSILKDKSK